ncbi:MAG: DUF305 domain-containing protein [Micromonosporaceae bacterium]
MSDGLHTEDQPRLNADEPPATGWWRGANPLVAAALAALLALAVGFATGVFAMSGSPDENSPEVGFAHDMSTHHSQAVEMGMIAWQRGSLPEVRTLGYDIALTQQAQIGLMLGWLEKWGAPTSSDQPAMAWMGHGEHMRPPDGRMPGMASPAQLEKLRNAEGKQFDVLFCQLMTDHHIAGVRMARAIVERTDEPEVHELASGMVSAQQNEIDVLRKLLVKLGAAA